MYENNKNIHTKIKEQEYNLLISLGNGSINKGIKKLISEHSSKQINLNLNLEMVIEKGLIKFKQKGD